jgi:hypothetical protein
MTGRCEILVTVNGTSGDNRNELIAPQYGALYAQGMRIRKGEYVIHIERLGWVLMMTVLVNMGERSHDHDDAQAPTA